MNRFLALFSSILLSLGGCEPSPFPGYSEVEPGIHYRRITLGDGERTPEAGDRLWVDVSYLTRNDSLLFRSGGGGQEHSSFRLKREPRNGFEKALYLLREGDSTHFIIDTEKLSGHRFMIPGWRQYEHIKIAVLVTSVDPPEQNKAEHLSPKKAKEKEQRSIEKYLTEKGLKEAFHQRRGIHFMHLDEGEGPAVKVGRPLAIHYKGFFLNGQCFDDSYARGTPLDFHYGDQGQVIEGLERGLSFMKEGSKARILLPSDLAFGASGSSTGIVPPYTPVVYEVEVVRVGQAS